MIAITVYEAEDGTQFKTETKCIRYEKTGVLIQSLEDSSMYLHELDLDELIEWALANLDSLNEIKNM